ncbi:unnamed protein product [Mytilus edulis]|uniref:Endonuclease/exonuclease/phosphatase domain-containing protein n=3 Tax=Mytilus TaxID=6548 RepID=A0A8S3UAD2_MYTED|nr:unnamed protein product [Mytilus edulis]
MIATSGGIALGYRKYLEKYIKPIETECKFVYWFTIDKKVLNLSENVFIGIVYIPPVNTNYTSEEAFNEIEIELQRFSEKSDYIILVGDFNSRTANLPDFYDEDDIDDFVIDNLTDQSDYTDVYMLDDLNIPRTRNNPDKVVNCYGRKFLEFCKNNKVFILTVECVSNFEILEFSKLFSDVHSPLKLSFNRVNPTFELLTTELSYQEENKIGKWKFEQVNDFKNNIDEDKIRNVIDELSVYSNKENVTKYEINTAVTNITDILIDSAKATFGTQTFNRNMLNCNKKHNKQWYNFDCKKAKKELRKAQRMYKHYGSNLFKERLRHLLTTTTYSLLIMKAKVQMRNLNKRTKLVESERRFKRACEQIVQLNYSLDALQKRYNRAKTDNNKSFRYSLRLRIAVVDGMRNMYYDYAHQKAESVAELRQELFGEVVDIISEDSSADIEMYD